MKVWDIHSHALLQMFYLKKDLTKRGNPPFFWNPLKSHIDLSRIRDGDVNCLTFAVYVPFRIRSGNYFEEALKMVNLLEEFAEQNMDKIEIPKTASDIERIIQGGRLAATVAVEGGHILEGRVENLETLKQKGVIYITLTHLHSNNIAESSFLRLHRARGLTDFGREVVMEMERLGILIDVAHCSERAFWEVLEITNAPIIYTHGGVRRYCDIERNLSDTQIKALSERGGIIGITFFPFYLRKWSLFGGIPLFVRVVEHVADIAGIGSIAIGSDFDGWIWTLRDVKDISDTWKVAAALRQTFSEEEVKKVLFENVRQILPKEYRIQNTGKKENF
ncbi:MAG: dipeptidase [Ignavibacteriales bacterium]